MLLTLLALACSGGGADSAPTDSAVDTAPTCTALSTADDWAWHGECPQMTTPCEITVSACAMTIAYSSGMDMNMPYSATVSGDTVTFGDEGGVTGCVGTITDTDKIEGTCDGGCTFTLRR